MDLGRIDYQIIHIPGSENYLGVLLSWSIKLGTETDGEVLEWVEPGPEQVDSMAVYVCLDADYRLLSRRVIKGRQLELGGLVRGQTSVRTVF